MNVLRKISDAYYYVINKYVEKSHLIDTKLPAGEYYDKDHKMLYGMMNLLVDYVEIEEPYKYDSDEIDKDETNPYMIEMYNNHNATKREILSIYNWWKNYDNRLKEINDLTNQWSDEVSIEKKQVPDITYYSYSLNDKDKSLLDKIMKLEEQLDKEEEEMLIRLVKVRGTLWT